MGSRTDTGGVDRAVPGDGGSNSGLDVRPIILAFGLLIIALIGIGVGIAIHEFRRRDLNEQRRALSAIDLLLVQETEHTLQSVDLVLVNISEKLSADGAVTAASFDATQKGSATYEMLKSRLIGIPQLDAISLVSATGKVINFSRSFPTPDINVTDRDYFRALKNMPSKTAFISAPVHNRDTGTWTIYLARRVSTSSGAFVGLVIGAIDLRYFESLYKDLQIGRGGAVSLWRLDGTLLARYPGGASDTGHTFAKEHIAKIAQSGRPTTLTAEGPQRLIATMAAKRFPIVVDVSRSTGAILADWNEVALIMAAATFLCIVALCFVLWLLIRQFHAHNALVAAYEERRKAIAERENAEAQLRQAQKLEAIGQLTGGIAHDFNNLLTAVLGNLELLKKQTDSSAENRRLHRWASNAYDAATRGAALTQRLLVFSRRQPLDPRATNITTLLASMSDLLRRTLGENIEIVTDVVPELWPAFVDLNQLDNAILNIAINARDAMEGRGHLIISARNCNVEERDDAETPKINPGDYVRLAITDTGKGIEQDVLERVFEPFFSTKPAGQGTGLGLSQVYGFVKQTGGHVHILSEPGLGTTVELYLPRAAQDDLAQAAPESFDEIAREPGMGATILIVEDDPSVRAYSGEILRELGFFVREAPNARAALDILRSDSEIDLLFSDIGLPGMNGPELVRAARQLRPNLKILLATGYAAEMAERLSQSLQGALLIAKPFGRTQLAETIRKLLPSPQRCA